MRRRRRQAIGRRLARAAGFHPRPRRSVLEKKENKKIREEERERSRKERGRGKGIRYGTGPGALAVAQRFWSSFSSSRPIVLGLLRERKKKKKKRGEEKKLGASRACSFFSLISMLPTADCGRERERKREKERISGALPPPPLMCRLLLVRVSRLGRGREGKRRLGWIRRGLDVVSRRCITSDRGRKEGGGER